MKLTTGYKKPIDSDGNVLLAGGGHKSILEIINDFGTLLITPSITFSQAINADILGNATTADRLKNDRDGTNSTAGLWNECKIEGGIIKYFDRANDGNTNYYHSPSYSTGLSIATGTGVNALYVPYATSTSDSSGTTLSVTALNGIIKLHSGATGTGAWKECKIYNGYVYYYDRANDGNTWNANTTTVAGYVPASGTAAYKVYASNTNANASWLDLWKASNTVVGGIKLSAAADSSAATLTASTDNTFGTTTTKRNYPVKMDSNGVAYVYVPWKNNTYSIPTKDSWDYDDTYLKLSGWNVVSDDFRIATADESSTAGINVVPNAVYIGVGPDADNLSIFSVEQNNLYFNNIPLLNEYGYVSKGGDTMTGQLVIKAGTGAGTNMYGIKLATDSVLTSLNNNVLLLKNNALRFSDVDSWNYDKWAGLKYDSTNKYIYLGLADKVVFTANTAQNNGKLILPGISEIRLSSATGSKIALVSDIPDIPDVSNLIANSEYDKLFLSSYTTYDFSAFSKHLDSYEVSTNGTSFSSADKSLVKNLFDRKSTYVSIFAANKAVRFTWKDIPSSGIKYIILKGNYVTGGWETTILVEYYNSSEGWIADSAITAYLGINSHIIPITQSLYNNATKIRLTLSRTAVSSNHLLTNVILVTTRLGNLGDDGSSSFPYTWDSDGRASVYSASQVSNGTNTYTAANIATIASDASTAYSWGNHASQGYLKSVSWNNISSKPLCTQASNISTNSYLTSTGWYKFLTVVNTESNWSTLVDFIISGREITGFDRVEYVHFSARPADASNKGRYSCHYTCLGGTSIASFGSNIYIAKQQDASNENKFTYTFYMKYSTASSYANYSNIKILSYIHCSIVTSWDFLTTNPGGTAITFGGYVDKALSVSIKANSDTDIITTSRTDNSLPASIQTDGWGGFHIPKLGIGTSGYLSTDKLYVDGDATITGEIKGTANTAKALTSLTSADAASANSTARRVWFSYNDNTTGRPAYSTNFTFRADTNSLTVGGSYYANSDIRYKNILEHISPYIEDLANIPLFKYTWLNKNDIKLGSSAQAVELILPELVSENEDGFKSLDYATLGAIAGVMACKEIKKLKQRIKELEEMLNG